MKLRTKLVLALFLLSVVPLMGATVYTYVTSNRAFRAAVQAEAGVLAENMGSRMEEVTSELSSRIERMRRRSAEGATPQYEKARRDALAAAEQEQLLQIMPTVLSETRRERGEVPFAVGPKGELFVADPADLPRLRHLPLVARGANGKDGQSSAASGDWVIVTRRDPGTGFTLGIARPVGDALKEIRNTAVRNLGYGLALVALALFGIRPLSENMTRGLRTLTDGAERLAQGDLTTRVPVESRDEIGRLAATFNRMAEELAAHQDRLVAQERLLKELELCRRIQEELLPREPLRIALAEAAGVSIPAREVGGDFFNYFQLPGDEAAILVGDVSGKGVAAALLMANLQAKLRGELALERELAPLAERLDREIHDTTPEATYLTLFLAVLDGPEPRLRYVNAGHNAPYLLRTGGGMEALESTGRPLGLLPGGGYEERRVPLAAGDVLVLFTDGLLDAENEKGEAFGAERLRAVLQREHARGFDGLLARVVAVVAEFRGGAEAPDDATLVVLKVGRAAA
jgi:serine phosphatase RsbU (regulator of sigma subunit)